MSLKSDGPCKILDYVIGLAPVFCLQHSAMIKHMRASLWLGESVNGFVAGKIWRT